MPLNIQENLPVAFAMLEKVPDKWGSQSYTIIVKPEVQTEGLIS